MLLHFYSIFDHLYLPNLHYYSIRFRFYCTRCMFIFNPWSISILCAKTIYIVKFVYLLCYKRFHWQRKISQVSSPDRLTSYGRKTNTKTKVIVSVGVKDSCIHRLSLSLSLSLSVCLSLSLSLCLSVSLSPSQTLFVTHHSADEWIIIQLMIIYNKGILKCGAFRNHSVLESQTKKKRKNIDS